jgi:TonB family protein
MAWLSASEWCAFVGRHGRGLAPCLLGLVLTTGSAIAQTTAAADTIAPAIAEDDPEAEGATPGAYEPADELPAPAEQSVVGRIETEIEFDRLVSLHEFRESLPVGEQLVTMTKEELGAESVEAGQAVYKLAEAQRQAGEHEAAERSYLEAVDIYRSVEGPFSPRVIEPLTGLGDSYQASADYVRAVSAYTEARTVNRRAYGLLNEGQIELLDRMTQSLMDMNQPLEAERRQLEALQLVERNHEPQSDEALAAIYKYAAWLREGNRYQEERDQYARALRTIRDYYGKDDLRQVRPLMSIGNSYRAQRIPDGQGSNALRDALALLLAQPDREPLLIAEALRDLGDWEVAFSKVNYEGAEYKRAWELLGAIKGGDELRKQWFTGPNYVLREPISQRGISFEPDAPAGHVLVRFDLDASGHPLNVAVVESEPAGFKDEAVTRHVRRSRFRPQLVNGEPVPIQGLALQFTFRYTTDALEAENDEDRDR